MHGEALGVVRIIGQPVQSFDAYGAAPSTADSPCLNMQHTLCQTRDTGPAWPIATTASAALAAPGAHGRFLYGVEARSALRDHQKVL